MSNLPYLQACSTSRSLGTIRIWPAAHSLSGNPLYYIAFASFWLAAITLLNIRGVDVGKWLNNIGALAVCSPDRSPSTCGRVLLALWAAIHITRGSLVPHWSLDNAVFWSNVFFAFSAVEAASAMGDEIQNPRRTFHGRFWWQAAFWQSATLGHVRPAAHAAAQAVAAGRLRDRHLHAGQPSGLGMAPDSGRAACRTQFGWQRRGQSLIHGAPAVRRWSRSLSAARLRMDSPTLSNALGGHRGLRVAGVIVALLSQREHRSRAYNVLVSMSVISLFLPYLFLFSAMIRMQSRLRT